MKARPNKPSARGTAAKKSAAAGKRAVVARKAKVTAKPAKAAKPTKASKTLATSKSGPAAKGASAAAATPSRASLGADCTIEHAPELQKQLGQVLDDRACVTLDFSAVKRCDTAGLQVLAAFIRERREAGREVALASMPDNFLATVKLLGLSALFAPTTEVGA